MNTEEYIKYFEDYDYNLLKSNDYKEDTVREEIVYHLVSMLGYTVGGENKVIRSKNFKHPYITVGSSQRKITYIPDYLLLSSDVNYFVLDAKGPSENIFSGKNVEQVYSYIIHPEIRTKLFALCNGYSISVFSINKIEPILHFDLQNIRDYCEVLIRILHPAIKANEEIVDFYPDLGIFYKMNEASKDLRLTFIEIHTTFISKLNDEYYTCITTVTYGDIKFALSIDFETKYLDKIIENCPSEQKNEIKISLKNAPFSYIKEDETKDIIFGATLFSDWQVFENQNESYIPFKIEEVL